MVIVLVSYFNVMITKQFNNKNKAVFYHFKQKQLNDKSNNKYKPIKNNSFVKLKKYIYSLFDTQFSIIKFFV